MRAVVGAVLIAVLVLGCDRGGTTLTEGPTKETLSGLLVGGSMNGIDCAWIEEPSGRPVEVFWPDQWRTEYDPVAVYDQNGIIIAKEGDTVTLSGFFSEVGASLCSTEGLFNAEKVISVSSRP